jgi:hypothetical protein
LDERTPVLAIAAERRPPLAMRTLTTALSRRGLAARTVAPLATVLAPALEWTTVTIRALSAVGSIGSVARGANGGRSSTGRTSRYRATFTSLEA